MKLVKFSRFTDHGNVEVYVNADQVAFIQALSPETTCIAFCAPQNHHLIAINVVGSVKQVRDELVC